MKQYTSKENYKNFHYQNFLLHAANNLRKDLDVQICYAIKNNNNCRNMSHNRPETPK